MGTFVCPSCKQADTPKVQTAFLGYKNVTCTKCGTVARYPMAWGLRLVLWSFTLALGIALLSGYFSFIFPLCVIGCILDLFLLINAPSANSNDQTVAQPDAGPSSAPAGISQIPPVEQTAVAAPYRPEAALGEAHLGHTLIGLFTPFIGLPMGVKRLKQGQRQIGMRLIVCSVWFGFLWILAIVLLILSL